jgi:hypothetical protein
MITVTLKDLFPNDILEIVRQLKGKGYIIGKDFDFSYSPPRYDNFSGESVYNRSVSFIFYKEELATWFSLVYP